MPKLRTDIDNSKEAIIDRLLGGAQQSVICAEFGCKPETLRKRLSIWGVDHLKNPAGRGKTKPWAWKSATTHLQENAATNVHRLKLKLWMDGLKPLHCEECGWNRRAADGRLPLELHHVNGNKSDNRLENLVILCPNYHALKDNHRGLSKRKGKHRPVE
jgi:hypothetical protein